MENLCWQMSECLTKSGNIFGAIRILELGERIDYKSGKRTYNWRKKIAESFEDLMNQEAGNNDLTPMFLCQQALKNYKMIKDEKKVRELGKKYTEMIRSMKLERIEIEIDLKDRMRRFRRLRAFAEKLIRKNPAEIIGFLMHEKNLLPTNEDVEKAAVEYSKQSIPFPKMIIDQSGHSAQYFSDEAERKYFDVLEQYRLQLELDRIYLINEIFLAAIQQNKLSADIMLKFLREHSWLGKTISKKLNNDQLIEYSWLSLIAPAFYEYFRQMHYFLLNPKNYPVFVLSIDSLTLKVEGLLRDICQFNGESTFYQTQDGKGRNITREKNIQALLNEESIKKLFDEDDLLFFKFLLVEKAGYNLRHRIAHSLMLFREYDIRYMHLLILAVLRLGKYDFVKEYRNLGL